jgi:translation initiation factor 4B
VSHKIISDFEGKPKGFGYVEFSTQDDLKSALDMTGGQLLGRTVRISVAEPREF